MMYFINFYLRKVRFVFLMQYKRVEFQRNTWGALMRYFRINKTYNMLHKHFFWPKMKHDLHKFCSQCFKCKEAKSRSEQNGLYTSLNVPNKLLTNISINFVLGLAHTKHGKDSIFVVVEKFSKMTHFIDCNQTDDANYVSDRNVKFLSNF